MPNQPLTPDSPPAERIPEIIRLLRKAHPDAKCALVHENALQLLVATILSAQCTDERVNKVTPALFAKYPTAEAFAGADRAELEEMIRSTGFYRNKAKNIQEACSRIVHEYGGEVPDDMEELITLPGVARKTANVVLGTAYGRNDGIVVDTHVTRLSQRLKLSNEKTPEKIERDLMIVVPQDHWTMFSHQLVLHGRAVCTARKPDCAHCPLADLCPSAGKV